MDKIVLVVDDEADVEPLFRQKLRKELKSGAFTLDFSLSGAEALEYMETIKPPTVIVLLSDVNMPGMSGLDLVCKVRPNRPDISIFMVTAYGDEDTRKKAVECGADKFFTKPVDFDALKDNIAQALAG